MFTDVVAKPNRVAWPDGDEKGEREAEGSGGGAEGSACWSALS
jgi:hypothetical protein